MDRATVGAGCIVGALTFVPADMQIPARKVVVGNPARVVKDVSDEMLAWKTEGTRLYQALPGRLHAGLVPCEPLREIPAERQEPVGGAVYETWHERRKGDDEHSS
jgi:phenylacetic acid degradation protein